MSRYSDFVAQGLCGSCGKEPIEPPSKSLGKNCKEKAKAATAAVRKKQRDNGLCSAKNCPNKPVSGGKCQRHLDAAKASRDRNTRKRIEEKLCRNSREHGPVKKGRTLCQACIDKMTAVSNARARAKTEAGLCRWGTCPKKPDREGGAYCKKHRKKDRERKLAYKLAALDAHGGRKCQQCPETDVRVLEIDHVDGGGCKHRKSLDLTGGTNFYRWLKREGYPKGYRVLCPTCNKRAHRDRCEKGTK